ncbi:Sialyltransferase-like protein 2 [Turnera subulata]|uniref:Sialyltransferase-like protein 2 n=1 Tax=Turnera subulata TaxID=218843 RepID=A0A9Q0JQA5_9ROSI|nr:Sialyltransferase-like protein 2 [Turnera subulata]
MRLLRFGLLLALASGFSAILIYITGLSDLHVIHRLSQEDLDALQSLQSGFQKCVSANGLGLQAVAGGDYCKVSMNFPSETIPKWKDPKTGELEGLSFEFNLCEAVATWEQVRNSTTILTREFIDALPNGWEDYAWRRINKGIQLNRCQNRSLCMEKLSLVLPQTPPYLPKQFHRCAVIGNSGDLLKTKFGKEIDGYDVVIRENGAPIENFTEYVGKKSTFRLLNRGSAKALDKVVELDAKGTGLKALEFALSICDSVDMYGFTVDPGYKEWTRYFSESRQGHTPLHGRAYYQMMECLGLIKIHSPMRADPKRVVRWVPSQDTIRAARIASEKLLGRVGAGTVDPLGACAIKKKRAIEKPVDVSTLRKAAGDHQTFVRGTTMYPLEHSPGHGGGGGGGGGQLTVTSSETVGTKRQRRPSVRLGEIGGDQFYDVVPRRTTSGGSKQWKQQHHHHHGSLKDGAGSGNPSSKGSKTRALTNLSAIGENLDENKDANLDTVAIGSWKVRDPKKRAFSKRVRSNWTTSKLDDNGSSGGGGGGGNNSIEGDGEDDLEENYRDYVVENSESPLKEQSPVHSLENLGDGNERNGREVYYNRRGIVRGRDNIINSHYNHHHDGVEYSGPSDTEVRDDRNNGGEKNAVRIWLNGLGLGRYAPVFEIHEVDDEVLPMLTLEDLKDMGINAVGSRRKMFCAIQKLGKGFS